MPTATCQIKNKEKRIYTPMEGLTMVAHTSTVAMLTESDKGVNT